MNFLSIPEEVIEGNLLPYLKWNDLLRFRRVCKVTHAITQGYMRVHPEVAPEIEIGDDDAKRSLGAFLKMNIPTNRIYLNNPSGLEFYEKDEKNIAKFLEKCGPLVKHLRLKDLSPYPYGKEYDFMDTLVNLQSVEAEYFGAGKTVFSSEELQMAMNKRKHRSQQDPPIEIPTVFFQLKSLRVGPQKDVKTINVIRFTEIYLNHGKSLERVSLPFNSRSQFMPASMIPVLSEGFDGLNTLVVVFNFIKESIQVRDREYPDNANLKTLDFCCYHDEMDWEALRMHMYGSVMFLELLGACIKYGVQLENVGSVWFNQWAYRSGFTDLGIPVLSLVNLHLSIFPVNMPNLEKVEIRAASQSSPGPHWREQRPEWPALKVVDITVDCKRITWGQLENGRPNGFVVHQDTEVIFQFFFQDIRRINLTEIRLHFTKEAGQVAIPNTDEIVDSCPNLKKITLINWPGTNEALVKLWDGLPALEEISLEHCKELGNVAFVGQDAKNPVFLKLTKLRKLSLKGLDQMPKITDTLFSDVLRHLNLTRLILTSDRPVKSVTSVGILSLLKGAFAEKIEKFSFQHWSLEGVSAEEFKKFEAKFRSYDMF